MATQPSSETMSTWLGANASVTTPSSASPGYYIPAANVGPYVGTSGNTAISNDIRDFLYSVLSKINDVYYQELTTGNTRPTTFNISKLVSNNNNKVVFTVTLNNITVVQPEDYISTLPTYS